MYFKEQSAMEKGYETRRFVDPDKSLNVGMQNKNSYMHNHKNNGIADTDQKKVEDDMKDY